MKKYHSQRNQFWPDIERFFGDLPPHLFHQATILKNNLSIEYSDTGHFKDILGRDHDYPLLTLHFWLLDDFEIIRTPQRATLERHLFLASTFTLAAVYTHENILDDNSPFDTHYLHLERLLAQQANFHLVQLFPGGSPFWGFHQSIWQAYAEALLLERQAAINGQLPDITPAQVANRLAFGKVPAVGVVMATNQEKLLPQLLELMDGLNFAFQILRDISTFRRDIRQRRVTYPILQTIQMTNLQQFARPEQLLGAMVLTGSLEKVCQAAVNQLETCRGITQKLNLPTFFNFITTLEDLITGVKHLFSIKKSARQKHLSSKLSFTPYVDPLAQAITMAEGYLLSDLTFRESWEVQRGLTDTPELIGQAFPGGLIVEILCRHGHALAPQVDHIFSTLQQTGFRYYSYAQLPPDADDLGLLLRLFQFAGPTRQKEYRDALETPLRWMENNILPTGEIPVWFKRDTPDDLSHLIWGHSCAATEINLLLGLLAFHQERYRSIINKSVSNLLQRLMVGGPGSSLYYPPPYTLWAAFQLIEQLTAKSLTASLGHKLAAASNTLLKHLELEIERPIISPQSATFYLLTCLSTSLARPLLKERWLEILYKSQRYDGSWDDEPFFLIPDRGKTAWYSSRSVTTAFCYHALKKYQISLLARTR